MSEEKANEMDEGFHAMYKKLLISVAFDTGKLELAPTFVF